MRIGTTTRQGPERAVLAGLELKTRSSQAFAPVSYNAEESLEELAALAESAGARVEERVIQTRAAPEAATLIGSGKIEELTTIVRAVQADVVIFDQELTPTQFRNLERALNARVIDRTQLILDIFARRARTREGQLQVELAQLNYLLPRLAGRGVEMSRLGGGIGTRGPGETQLETDRRRIERRIQKITKDIESVRRSRSTQRRQRRQVPLASAALVGYTNAGKSTLFNRLTGAGVVADARLFATLDPTVRVIELPSRRRILAADTVGFIRALPTTLVKAFRATLEEVVEATLLLHVVDASSEHAAAQAAHVAKVLAEIGAESTPQLLVLNKVDLIGNGDSALALRARLAAEAGIDARAGTAAVSAKTGEGMEELASLIDRALPLDPLSRLIFRIPASDGAAIHDLHQHGRILSKRFRQTVCEIEADVPESVASRLSRFVKKTRKV